MASFLSVSLKKTSEVNLTGPLQTYIATTFGNEGDAAAEYGEAVADFNKLRNRATCQPLDKHESSLEVLYRYFDQLVAMENKLPLAPTQIPVAFKWKDAFDKALSYGSFERACVLFNIAALQSQIGAAQTLATDEEMKAAAKLFQMSAGAFTQLKDGVLAMVPADPTPDLLPDTLGALAALMIAQAQEAIYLKAAKDKMKAVLLVKIAAQCSIFYQDAVKQMSRDGLKGLWDKEWIAMLNGKQFAFQALAQYHQALVNNEKKEIGEELARLQESVRLMQQAQSYLTSANAQALRTEAGVVQRAHDQAKKDNDFIVRAADAASASVASFSTTSECPTSRLCPRCPPPRSPRRCRSPLRSVLASKVIACSRTFARYGARFADVFERLVPVGVRAALSNYDMRRGEIVNTEIARMREHTQLLNGVLASLNLPAALDDVCNQEALPESVRDKSARVKSGGGARQLEQMMADLPALLKRNKEILDESNRLLTEERASDEQLRGQFKEKWTRMASEQLTEPLWQEMGKYRGILDSAVSADAVVRAKFESNANGIGILSKTEPELKAEIPGLGDAAANAKKTSPTVARLKDLMAHVDKLKKDRDECENAFKAVSFDMAGEFLKALGESGALNDQQMITDKLNGLYGSLRGEVSESIARQEKILQDIQAANMQFNQEKAGSGGGAAREDVLKMLASAHDAFMELRGNLEEGTKFYNDLTPLLVRLQQKVSDFCFARKTEKDDLMKDLQQNIVNQPAAQAPTMPDYHGGGNQQAQSTAPPARPPPPNFQQQPPPQAYGNPFGAPTTQAQAAVPPPVYYQQQQAAPYPAYQPQSTAPPPPNYQQGYPAYQTAQPYPYYPTYPGAAAPTMPTGYNPYAMPQPQQPYPPPSQQQQQQQQPYPPQQPYPQQRWQ